jgi:hypothetical protein
MIGPFDVWTTASSGERAGAAGAGWAACSTDFCCEHPVSSALADAARTVYPNSLRLKATGALLVCGEGPHVPHPAEWQPPHVVLDVPITLSGFSIALPLSRRRFVGFQGRLSNGCRDAGSEASGWPVKFFYSRTYVFVPEMNALHCPFQIDKVSDGTQHEYCHFCQ